MRPSAVSSAMAAAIASTAAPNRPFMPAMVA